MKQKKVYRIKLLFPIGIVAILISLWGFVLFSPVIASVEQQTPNVATLHVTIEHVNALDDFDDCELDWLLNCKSPADLRTVVIIDGQRFEAGPINDTDSITPANWTFSRQVSVNSDGNQNVQVIIEIWDSDEDGDGWDDDDVDLDSDDDPELNLRINLNDCIEGKPGAVAGNFDTTKNCHESITSQGSMGNPALIRFRIIAETPKDTLFVKNEAGEPIANAEIRQFRGDELRNTFPTDASGKVVIPCLQPGDELVAMQLMHTQPVTDSAHSGWHHRTYLTSFDYQPETGDALPYVADSGECSVAPIELIIKKNSPLVLFNLVISLGWGADNVSLPINFVDQLERALNSANRVIFDVTDGQFAFGQVSIHNGREFWDDADLQITPSNYRRPYAIPGGITRHNPYTYTSSVLSTTVFYPGYIRIGRAWNQLGEPDASLDQSDGFRMLAHEFVHYAFMVLDEYFYFDANNLLRPATCPGSLMFDSYLQQPELDMQGNQIWSDTCRLTEQFLTHGESAWETLIGVYADHTSPPRWQFRVPSASPKSGPADLPFRLATIRRPPQGGPSDLANGDGRVRLTVETAAAERSYTGQIQIFALRKNVRNILRIFEQGTVNKDGIIDLVGIKAGDVIVVTSWDGLKSGTKRYENGTEMKIQLAETSWRPSITATPIQNADKQVTEIAIEVEQKGALQGNLMAAMIPLSSSVTISDAIQLTLNPQGKYTGVWHFPTGKRLDEAFLWIGDVRGGIHQIYADLTRQVVLPITLGGSPDSHKRSNPPKHPASSDGYCQLHVPNAAWSADLPIIVLSPQSLPLLDNSQKLVSAPCYIGVPTSTSTFGQPVALTIYYNSEAAKGIQYERLQIYHWDEVANQWTMVAGRSINPTNYLLSAGIQKPGLYVAMAVTPSQVILTGRNPSGSSGPDASPVANVVISPVTVPVMTTFGNCKDAAAFNLDPAGISRFHMTTPAYVNNLSELLVGKTYYIAVGDNCTINLAGLSGSNGGMAAPQMSTMPMIEPIKALTVSGEILPMTLYGSVDVTNIHAPVGTTITALINGKPLTEAKVANYQGVSVYVLDMPADDVTTQAIEGGQPGQTITFQMNGVSVAQTTTWQPGYAQQVNFTSTEILHRSFLPLIAR